MRQRRNGTSEGGRGGTALTPRLQSQGSGHDLQAVPGEAEERGREESVALSPPRKGVAQR